MRDSPGPLRGKSIRWRNWSDSARARPQAFIQPRSLDELSRVVASAAREGRHVRVVGDGHSFTPLVPTDGILLSLDNLQGIESANSDALKVARSDAEQLARSGAVGPAGVRDSSGAADSERGPVPGECLVRVWAGSRLKRLGDDLLARGLAQENLGDIDVQSIAGAISTGTHGTGISFGTIATQVAGLTLVTASGDVLECSEDRNPEVFKAAQVSLGALGVIVAVTLRVVPAKRLHFESRRERVDDCLANLERYKRENDHFEFFWMPYTPWAQAKFLKVTDAQPTTGNIWGTLNKIMLENGLYWVLSECARIVPPLSRTVSRVSAWGIASVSETDYSHRLFATPRFVKFQEMEYNIPAQHFPAVLGEIRALLKRQCFNVHFPIECRFVRGDDIWLSPAYQRDSAYIAVHMYKGMPYERYFRAVEEVYQAYEGRPHWGKMHTATAATLAQRYPRWHDFRRVRAALDPDGIFLNDYLRVLLDADAPISTPVTVPRPPSHGNMPSG